MQTWQRPDHEAGARDRRLSGLRRLTLWAAAGGVAGIGLFGTIGAATIPGSATAATQSTPSSSSDTTSAGTQTVQAPASTPTSSSGSTTHAVSGGS